MTCTKTLLFTIASMFALAGCPASDDGTGDGGSDTGSTGPTTSGTAPSTMSTTTTPADDDGMDASASGDDVADDTSDTMQPTTGTPTTGDPSTDDGSSGGAGSGSEGSGSEGSSGGAGGVCDPDGGDDECATCVKTNCCTQLEACAEDAGCTCFQDCVEMNPGVAGAIACGGDCDVMIFGEGPTADLVGCSSAPPCAAPCGV